MKNLPVSSFAIQEHLNSYLYQLGNNPAPIMSRFSPGQMPAGSVVVIDGDYNHFDDENEVNVDMPSVQVTVMEYIRLDSGQLVLVGNVEVQKHRYSFGKEQEPKTEIIKGFFNPNLVTSIVSTGTATKTRIRCQSQYYREFEKANRGFSVSFFTPGTRVRLSTLVKTEAGSHEVTVNRIAYNGPNSVLLLTDTIRNEGYFKGESEMFNISHVEEILEHKSGPLVWERDRTPTPINSDRMYGSTKRIAGKNHFVGYSSTILSHAASQWLPDQPGVSYDFELLLDLLFKCGVMHGKSVHDDRDYVTIANKKKLKRAVRRLRGKVSVSAAQRQREEDDDNNRMMEQDMRYDDVMDD